MASGIPDDEVAGSGVLGHLPVVYRAACSDPGSQFGDVLRLLIHLKYVNFNQDGFQVQMPALREVTILRELLAATADNNGHIYIRPNRLLTGRPAAA
jgi:hypothetical protein